MSIISRSGWDSLSEIYPYEFSPNSLEEDLFHYLEKSSNRHDEIKYYYENGELETPSSLNESENEHVEMAVENTYQNQCYYNTQMVMEDSCLVYVEGYVTSRECPYPIPHAWLEIDISDGVKIVEVTLDEPSDIYFGVEFCWDIVRDALVAREKVDPIVEYILDYSSDSNFS